MVLAARLAADVKGARMHLVERMVSFTLIYVAPFCLMNNNDYIERKQRMVPTHLNLEGEKPKEEERRWKWAHPVTKRSPAG